MVLLGREQRSRKPQTDDWERTAMGHQEEHAEYDGTYVVEGGWGTLQVVVHISVVAFCLKFEKTK